LLERFLVYEKAPCFLRHQTNSVLVLLSHVIQTKNNTVVCRSDQSSSQNVCLVKVVLNA